jgi:hypothetical protein
VFGMNASDVGFDRGRFKMRLAEKQFLQFRLQIWHLNPPSHSFLELRRSLTFRGALQTCPIMAESPLHPGRKSGGKGTRNGKSGGKKLVPLEDNQTNALSNSLATMKSIEHKKDLVEALRRTNPASVTSAPNIFWDVEGALKTSLIDDSDLKQQMTIVENGVNYNIKRYNDLRVMNERLTLDLKVKLDELDDQKSSFEELTAMKNVSEQPEICINVCLEICLYPNLDYFSLFGSSLPLIC